MSKKVHDGIGGTDVAAIVDLYRDEGLPRLDPWKSALDVYERILNGRPGEQKISFRARIGQIVEPKIFGEYIERNGLKRHDFRRNVEMHLDGFPQFRGELDAVSKRQDLGVDCKLVGRFASEAYGEEGTDEMPSNYLLQLAWYRILSGVGLMHLACWWDSEIEGEHYRQYTYTPDAELEETLRYCTSKFWHDHVERKVPPAVQYPSDSGAVSRLFPKQTLELREATPEEVELVEAIQRMQRDSDKLNDGLEVAKAELKRLIGFNEGLVLPDGAKVTFKASKTSSKTDWQKVAENFANVPEYKQFVEANTTEKPGARPLRVPKLKE